MAAKVSNTRVAVSYDSHSDTSISGEESDAEERSASTSQNEASDHPVGSDADVGKEEFNVDADVSEDESNEDSIEGSGMANVLAKILGKQTKSKDVILAKAKTDRQIQYIKREKLIKEEDEIPKKKKRNEDDEELLRDLRDRILEREGLEKKKQWEEMGRVRPNPLEKDNERRLKRIATQGVVQLFNAVKSQQKVIEDRLKEVGSSEAKREKVLRSIKKGDFLDMLKPITPNVVSEPQKMSQKKTTKKEPISDDENDGQSDQPGWKILREDFMMGATMKDWDKQSDDDSDIGNHEDSSGDEDS